MTIDRKNYKCPCCNNPWAAATGEFFAKICGECEPTTEAVKSKAISRDNMDATTLPSSNFYQYSNGQWLEKNPIPAGYPVRVIFVVVVEEGKLSINEFLFLVADPQN